MQIHFYCTYTSDVWMRSSGVYLHELGNAAAVTLLLLLLLLLVEQQELLLALSHTLAL